MAIFEDAHGWWMRTKRMQGIRCCDNKLKKTENERELGFVSACRAGILPGIGFRTPVPRPLFPRIAAEARLHTYCAQRR